MCRHIPSSIYNHPLFFRSILFFHGNLILSADFNYQPKSKIPKFNYSPLLWFPGLYLQFLLEHCRVDFPLFSQTLYVYSMHHVPNPVLTLDIGEDGPCLKVWFGGVYSDGTAPHRVRIHQNQDVSSLYSYIIIALFFQGQVRLLTD